MKRRIRRPKREELLFRAVVAFPKASRMGLPAMIASEIGSFLSLPSFGRVKNDRMCFVLSVFPAPDSPEMTKETFVEFPSSAKMWSALAHLVQPSYRKKGVAKKFIFECINYCKNNNLKKIILDVNEENHGAINFYRKNQFIFCGKRKGYYRQNGLLKDSFTMHRIV